MTPVAGRTERTILMTQQAPRAWNRRVLLSAAVVATGALARSAAAQESTPGAGSEVAPQLPVADLPTMNEQGFTFELDSTWAGSFENVPTEAPVYQMTLPTFDAESVAELAASLGIDGEVQDQGNGTYMVDGNGSLFVTSELQQYVSNAEAPDGDLPTDDQAIAYAREWLRQVGQLPANAGEGFIVARIDEPARVIVSIPPIQPENLLSSYPAINVTMGPQAAIIEAAFRWASLSSGDLYALLAVDAAWTEVAERRSYLQAEVPGSDFEPGSTLSGTAEYTQVDIAYTSSGIPGQAQYLQPVYEFSGQLTITTAEASSGPYPITAYVPALINTQQPVG
jgi:hypothetical protein